VDDPDGGHCGKLAPERRDEPVIELNDEQSLYLGRDLPREMPQARPDLDDLVVRSEPGRGTKVRATFRLGHIDLQPLGDMAESLTVLMVGHPDVHFRYTHITDAGRYVFQTGSGKAASAGIQDIAGARKDIRGGIARIRRKP